MRWLAFLHPAGMVLVLGLGLLVLREGLALRRARLRAGTRSAERHRRLARLLLPLVWIGYASGLASMLWLRSDALLESLHWPLVTTATLAMTGAGAIGLSLERGRSLDARQAHALLGAGGMLVALFGAAAGMVILP